MAIKSSIPDKVQIRLTSSIETILASLQPHAKWIEKMAVRLCNLIDKNDDKHGQKILALARELLTMVAEPTTVQQVLAEEKKRPQGEVVRKPLARRVA